MAEQDVIQKVVEQQVLTVAKVLEDQLDDEISKLNMLEEDDIEILREQRLRQLKQMAAKKQQWLSQGHGEYQEITEKDFFSTVKKSDRVVCHFYRENWPCKVMDKHLSILAKQHLETRFLKIHAEKSPFLTDRLKIVVLPTLALIKKGKVDDYVVGFDQLGGTDEFTSEELEERLASSGLITVDGEGSMSRPKPPQEAKRSIRQSTASGSDDDDD